MGDGEIAPGTSSHSEPTRRGAAPFSHGNIQIILAGRISRVRARAWAVELIRRSAVGLRGAIVSRTTS